MFDLFPSPVLFAHRGASAHAPENTLPAFELALRQGADGVELDAKLSADGQVVVIHDQTVDRTTGGRGRVRDLRLAELQALEAGSFFSEAFRGAQIPTLDEIFETIGARALINVELTNYGTPRDRLVEKVCGLIEKHGLQDRILLSSFFASNLRQAARLLPGVPRGLLALGGWMGAWARSFAFMFGDYQALHPHLTDAGAEQVERAHKLNRRIHVWTANTPEEIRRLMEWRVDGFFTDDPQMAARALGRTGVNP
jgi:glycerophosphoryl diester phosphodiesterase